MVFHRPSDLTLKPVPTSRTSWHRQAGGFSGFGRLSFGNPATDERQPGRSDSAGLRVGNRAGHDVGRLPRFASRLGGTSQGRVCSEGHWPHWRSNVRLVPGWPRPAWGWRRDRSVRFVVCSSPEGCRTNARLGVRVAHNLRETLPAGISHREVGIRARRILRERPWRGASGSRRNGSCEP